MKMIVKIEKRSLSERLKWIDEHRDEMTPLAYECCMKKLREDWIEQKMRKDLYHY